MAWRGGLPGETSSSAASPARATGRLSWCTGCSRAASTSRTAPTSSGAAGITCGLPCGHPRIINDWSPSYDERTWRRRRRRERPERMNDASWKEVWNRKGAAAAVKAGYSVEDLFEADGFDSALGRTTKRTHDHLAQSIRRLVGIEPGRRILEVGCGAGAVLSLLRDAGAVLCGVDYSEPHIEIARRVLPGCELHVAEGRA